ncbi:MAG: aspartate aminotransferase family protein [Anaerolineales bacterium]|nr:aspartate aminotransferase family protein [Anaerolineales bacterium]
MDLKQAQELEGRFMVQTYGRHDVLFVRGHGVRLFDHEGNEYLDMAAGIAVNALGHSDPDMIRTIRDQAWNLVHVSNFFYTRPQIELAEALVKCSFADRVFFTNSGSEANETALKFARKWARRTHGADKNQVVAFTGAFHGRSMGALSLTHKQDYRDPFQPLLTGVHFAEFNDEESASEKITDETCAVFVEPVQGEGGVVPATSLFIQRLRQLCDRHNALLVFDEVQCGLGRTGSLWAHEPYGIAPDIMTLAKPLAGGLPIGVTLVREEVAAVIEKGEHGSTFGGGPVVCAAGKLTLARVKDPQLLQQVRENGQILREALENLPGDAVQDVRGAGLLIGVELSHEVKPLIQAALNHRLVLINAGPKVIRMCPPLTISAHQIEEAVTILSRCIADVWNSH